MRFVCCFLRVFLIQDEIGRIAEITPVCCLDFYVHESCQRKGIGKMLFEHMLTVSYVIR